ncbi:MAG TPA: hypothetical protein V6D12_01320 [Candidatus Obscuribacterales bacterium]
MELMKKLSMPPAVAAKPASWVNTYINLRNSSFAITTTATLLLAAVTPAQAGPVGFSNPRINGVLLETDAVGTTPLITSNDGSFTFTMEVFNQNPSQSATDTFQGTFSAPSPGSTLPQPGNFNLNYSGNASANNPQLLSYNFNYNSPGQYNGTLTGNFVNSNPDFDSVAQINGRGDGVLDTEAPTFGFTLSTPVPFEPSPTLGLLILGAAWGGVQWTKQKLGSKKKIKA